MQATFSDPKGPRWIHVLLQAPAALCFALAIFGGFAWSYAAMLLALSIIASSSLAMLSLRQTKPAPVRLTLGPGTVKVHGPRLRSPLLRAKDVLGASTARTDAGFALSLMLDRRDAPATIVVPTEAEVEKLRLALGIGHGGHGRLAWWTQPPQTQKSALWGRLMSALAMIAVVASFAFAGPGDALLFRLAVSGLAMFAVPIGLALSIAGHARVSYPDIEMTRDGIRLATTTGPFLLPYAHYGGFEREGDHLVFKVPPPWNTVHVVVREPGHGAGLSDADLELLRAQLDGAALRARGYGRSKEEVAGRVEVLRRGQESTRDWLARLDLVGQTLSAGPGYRGQALDAEDLWRVLEDPDAELDLRTAAARVLRHTVGEGARARIDAAAAAIRDDLAHQRVRVAALPLDEAAAEMEELDQRRMRMAFR